MNINNLLLITGIAALSSCSSAYQTAQTPDDLYYSAPVERNEYVAVSSSREKERYTPNDDLETYRNDRWLRMSVGSPYRMSLYNRYYWDDWGYGGFGYSPYSPFSPYSSFSLSMGFGGGYGFMNPWYNPWAVPVYWNSFYNPYAFNYNPHFYSYPSYMGGGYYGNIFSGVKPPVYNPPAPSPRPSTFNRGAYQNTSTNRSYYNPRTGTYSNYNNTNSADSRTQRRVTNSSNNTYYDTRQNSGNSGNRTYTPPQNRAERTYTPAPSSSPTRSSGSGNTGGGNNGGVRRPTRN